MENYHTYENTWQSKIPSTRKILMCGLLLTLMYICITTSLRSSDKLQFAPILFKTVDNISISRNQLFSNKSTSRNSKKHEARTEFQKEKNTVQEQTNKPTQNTVLKTNLQQDSKAALQKIIEAATNKVKEAKQRNANTAIPKSANNAALNNVNKGTKQQDDKEGQKHLTMIKYRPNFRFTSMALEKPVSFKNITVRGVTEYYESCMHIPTSLPDQQWPEEMFIYDPRVTNLANIPNPANCIVKLVGPDNVKLGDRIYFRVELFDSNGLERKIGGDLVRVWLREDRLGAATVGKVTDNMDGTYDAEFVAYWTGRPLVRVAVINPREVIAIQFRRRYICPQVDINTGEFELPGGERESRPCSYYPQIPGFTELCNLTDTNYARPWFCAKPRSQNLTCTHWQRASDRQLIHLGYENKFLSPLENRLLTREYQGMIIPTNITVQVKSDDGRVTVPSADLKCNNRNRKHTWSKTPPTGYLYNKRWTIRTCKGRDRSQDLTSCVKNTRLLFIGDSTLRQMFFWLARRFPCHGGFPNETYENMHDNFFCNVTSLNFNFEHHSHELPFCAHHTQLGFLKPVKNVLAEYQRSMDGSNLRVVVLIHLYSHFLNYHSHVVYAALTQMKDAVIEFLNTNPNARVVIKGPHSYAFDYGGRKFEHFPERYMEAYVGLYRYVFRDVQDRVIYLDSSDITVATENNNLHPNKFIVREFIHSLFDFVCPY